MCFIERIPRLYLLPLLTWSTDYYCFFFLYELLKWCISSLGRTSCCTELVTVCQQSRAMCVYSNSRNDVPRVAQRYGTIAAHTRRCASVLVVFVVFCVHMHSFAGLIRRTPPTTFSDSAITDRHSDTTIFQLRAPGEL